jgi:hypothetical protein
MCFSPLFSSTRHFPGERAERERERERDTREISNIGLA